MPAIGATTTRRRTSPARSWSDDEFDWGDDEAVRPRTTWAETVVYELHVKGFTKLHARVPEALRGTYAGLGTDAAVRLPADLGVTAVELLPVHQYASEPHVGRAGLTNYWGYNTLGFFAPHSGYSSAGGPRRAGRPSSRRW